jgi:hypothetical protein
MKNRKNLYKAFGKDEFGMINYPIKLSNIHISRLFKGEVMGCSYCFPHGPETINSKFDKLQRNWKKYRNNQWK